MSQFATRPERASRLFQMPVISPVPAAVTQLSLFGPVGEVSAILIEAPLTNTLPVEIHPFGGVSGNGILLYPGFGIVLDINDAQNVAINDPAASGVQTLRVLQAD